MKPQVQKTYLKTIKIADKYPYRVFLVTAGEKNEWLEAQPVWKGIQRTAESMHVLQIILANDIRTLEMQTQKVR